MNAASASPKEWEDDPQRPDTPDSWDSSAPSYHSDDSLPPTYALLVPKGVGSLPALDYGAITLDCTPPLTRTGTVSTDAPNLLRLLIKPSAAHIPPFALSIEPKRSVRDLKSLIADKYPGSPANALQRLVFSGKVMKDSQKLSGIFPTVSAQHTVLLTVQNPDDDARYANGAIDDRDYTLPVDDTRFFRWQLFLQRIAWPVYYTVLASTLLFTILMGLRWEETIRVNWIVVFLPLWLSAPAWITLWIAVSMTLKQAGEPRRSYVPMYIPAILSLMPIFAPLKLEGYARIPWPVICIPLWISLLALLFAGIALMFDGIISPATILALFCPGLLFSLFVLFYAMRLDDIVTWPYTSVLVPLFILICGVTIFAFAIVPAYPPVGLLAVSIIACLLTTSILGFRSAESKAHYSISGGVLVPVYIAHCLLAPLRRIFRRIE